MNEKEQLLEYIRQTEENADDITILSCTKTQLVSNEKMLQIHKARTGTRVFGFIFCMFIIGAAASESAYSNAAATFFILLFFIFPILFWSITIIRERNLKRKHKQYSEEYWELANRLLYWLPPHNRDLTYFYKIKEMVQYGRANSLGEALNIIEREESNSNIFLNL